MSPRVDPSFPPRGDVRVIVVEDERRWRDLLVEMIPEMGFPTRGARSAEEAMRLMEADAADVLLFDLHLPSQGGLELFAQARRHWPAVQGIVLTAYGDLSAAQESIRLEVVDFLTKPCHLADIERALDRARRRVIDSRSPSRAAPPTPLVGTTLEQTEAQLILDALARHADNKSAAARELGISRRSLYDRLTAIRSRCDRRLPS